MIPDDAVSMVELPRNRNGKVDRRALAATLAPRTAIIEWEVRRCPTTT